MNTTVIIRGVSGCGKNFTANFIQSLYPESLICSADDYYTEKYGYYKFIPEEIGAAHQFCRDKFLNGLKNNSKVIIICNTNSTEKQFSYYMEKSKEFGYNIICLVIENRADTQNVHNVPELSLQTQENNIRNSLKLR